MTFLLFALLAQSPVTDFVASHCTGCHQGPRAPFGLDFTQLDLDLTDREKSARWVRVHDAVANGSMPPGARVDAKPFLTVLAAEFRRFEQQQATRRGRGVLRRLNRYEYENTLRDLLGAPWLRLRDSLPEDGIAHRFNKSGEALDVSHIQMARYLETAEQALRDVLAARATPPTVRRFYARQQQRMIRRMFYGPFNNHPERAMIPVLGFDAQPDVLTEKAPMTVPANRELEGFATPAGTYNGNDYSWDQFQAPAGGRYKLRLHSYSLWIHTVWEPLNNKNRPPYWRPNREKTERGRTVEPLSLYALRPGGEKRYLTTIDIGPEPRVHEVSVDLLPGDSISPDAARLFRSRPGFVGSPHASQHGMPGLVYRWMEVEGPLPAATPELIPSTREEAPAYLRRFLERALRRPVRESEFTTASRILTASKSPLPEAMIESYQAILCSPAFLYLEAQPGPLDSWALASRLSYLLTNSAPDAELRRLASQGQLERPAVLLAQAERLLAGPLLHRFTDAFLDYWLDLRKLNDNTPDQVLYPEYYLDDLLTESAEAQTRRFFAHLIEANQPVSHLARSPYTFLNEHLARHYGLPAVPGSAMRKVDLPVASPRGGLLTQASVLKITANGTTTSPVLRGAWIMERLLGMPPPPPPAGVSAVEPDTRGATTIREQLDKHRADPSCAACHRKIDPPGFALEAFDVLGGQRTHYRSTEEGPPVPGLGKNGHAFTFRRGKPVDTSGDFFGKPFAGIAAFQQILAADDRQLARNLLNQFLVYATGAPVRLSDRPAREALLDQAARDGYRVRSLILALLASDLFRHK
ncbi:MAG: DUF1592 domain-containing protein [Acidobacteriota bacterium]